MQEDRAAKKIGQRSEKKKSQENQSQALIQALVELSVLSCSDRRGKGKAHKSTDTGTFITVW